MKFFLCLSLCLSAVFSFSQETQSSWTSSQAQQVVQAVNLLTQFFGTGQSSLDENFSKLFTQLTVFETWMDSQTLSSQYLNGLLADQLDSVNDSLSSLISSMDNSVNYLSWLVNDVGTLVNNSISFSERFDTLCETQNNILGVTRDILSALQAMSASLNGAFNSIVDVLKDIRLGTSISWPEEFNVNVVGGSVTVEGGDVDLDEIKELITPYYEFFKNFQYDGSVTYQQWALGSSWDLGDPFEESQLSETDVHISARKGDFITPIYNYFEAMLDLGQQQFIALQRLCAYLSPTNDTSESEIESTANSFASSSLEHQSYEYIDYSAMQSTWEKISSPLIPDVSQGSIPNVIRFPINLPQPFVTQGIVIETRDIRELLEGVHYFFKAVYFLTVISLIVFIVRINIWFWSKMISLLGKFTDFQLFKSP